MAAETIAWSGVDWSGVAAAFNGDASTNLQPLMQSALDSIEVPASTLCKGAAAACAAGLFALKLRAIDWIVQTGSLSKAEAAAVLEPQAESFARRYSAELQGKRTLQEEFGDDRKEPLTLPQIAFQLLGSFLYHLAGLPTPEDKAVPEFGEQFAFGANWRQFVDRGRISVEGTVSAAREVRRAIGGSLRSFEGISVLDLGCGSGLQSLALHLQGATVESVDAQQAAVEATRELQKSFVGTSPAASSRSSWRISQASAMDALALSHLGPVDIVYSWGVLHHTGDMWQALHNAQLAMAEDGLLLAALYAVEFYDEKPNLMLLKQAYRNASVLGKRHLEIAIGLHWLRPLLRAGRSPFQVIREFSKMRGMDFWTDVRDWLGGWPMQFASASAVMAFARRSGLHCIGIRRYGGNTEFQLTRSAGVKRWTAGRQCFPVPAERFQEDGDEVFSSVQQKFYYHREKIARRWFMAKLPSVIAEFSDSMATPQGDRLLLLTASEEPYGYPSAQFARPDALADDALAFHGFWDGFVFASPAASDNRAAFQGLSVCLLPDAELSADELQRFEAEAEKGIQELTSSHPKT